MVDALGAVEGGLIEYHYVDAVKLAGHSCMRISVRDLAMFDLAVDNKLRGCDLVNLNVRYITHGSKVLARAMVVQRVDRTFIGVKRAQAASLPK